MEKIIKFRLFTWFKEVDSPMVPGQTVLQEQIAHFGEKVDITNPAYVLRGEELGAFYTDEEAEQIEAGKYRGPDAELLRNARAGIKPTNPVLPVDGEGVAIEELTSDELADYIREQQLNPSQVINLAGDDEDSINKVLDAETMATDNDPRPEVTSALDAKLAAVVARDAAGASTPPPPEIDATDSARKMAKANEVDLSTLKGSGKDGRIVATDVQAAVEARTANS